MHFDLISNMFLCRYASRTLRMKLLTWCRVMSGRAGLGSGVRSSAYFESISGLHTKLFYDIKSNDFFFRDIDLLCSPRYFCEQCL